MSRENIFRNWRKQNAKPNSIILDNSSRSTYHLLTVRVSTSTYRRIKILSQNFRISQNVCFGQKNRIKMYFSAENSIGSEKPAIYMLEPSFQFPFIARFQLNGLCRFTSIMCRYRRCRLLLICSIHKHIIRLHTAMIAHTD